MKYRKIPVEIESLQLTERNILEVYCFINGEESVKLNCNMARSRWEEYEEIVKREGLQLKTLESHGEYQKAIIGDYIIKGVKGEFYPCREDIFKITYEKV